MSRAHNHHAYHMSPSACINARSTLSADGRSILVNIDISDDCLCCGERGSANYLTFSIPISGNPHKEFVEQMRKMIEGYDKLSESIEQQVPIFP